MAVALVVDVAPAGLDLTAVGFVPEARRERWRSGASCHLRREERAVLPRDEKRIGGADTLHRLAEVGILSPDHAGHVAIAIGVGHGVVQLQPLVRPPIVRGRHLGEPSYGLHSLASA